MDKLSCARASCEPHELEAVLRRDRNRPWPRRQHGRRQRAPVVGKVAAAVCKRENGEGGNSTGAHSGCSGGLGELGEAPELTNLTKMAGGSEVEDDGDGGGSARVRSGKRETGGEESEREGKRTGAARGVVPGIQSDEGRTGKQGGRRRGRARGRGRLWRGHAPAWARGRRRQRSWRAGPRWAGPVGLHG